ncbi:MAG: hypothetical protein ACQETH_01410 [Candidatus Rifleibacteriota bacterium]
MKKLYTTGFLLLLAIFCFLAGGVFAQQNLELDLKLNNNNEFPPVPESGEFNLSLASQMFETHIDKDTEKKERTRLVSAISDVEIHDSLKNQSEPEELFSPLDPDIIQFADPIESEEFASTLTLNNGYSSQSMANNSDSLKIEKRMGKFKLLGRYEQKAITRIPVPINNADSGYPNLSGESMARGSIISQSNDQDTQQNLSSALASKYYLEAVYSFQPKVQGKVSYRRSMIDSLQAREELQVEGVVETGSDVLIKAGYNNETKPEINEPKSSKDSKVWTEFILKF